MIITKQIWKKTIETVDIDLPTEPMYLWHSGIRRSYSVIPEWTTWQVKLKNIPEEITQYKITIVDPNKKMVKAMTIGLTSLLEIKEDPKHELNRVIENMFEKPTDEVRTKEQFMEDYNYTLTRISENL